MFPTLVSVSGLDILVVAGIAAIALFALSSLRRRQLYDLDKIPGPWKQSMPVVGNVLECLRPDFHHVILNWADKYGGILRAQFLWQDALVVTDPAALAAIMGRGEGAMDKAAGVYAPINKMCDPHSNANLLTSAADDTWKAVRKAVAVSFSMQNIKKKYPLVLNRINQLVERIKVLGPQASIDVDQAALRVTLDVIGLAGFSHDFGSVHKDEPEYDHLLRVLPRCFTEVMLRIANPLRPVFPTFFKYGPKGTAAFTAFQAEMNALLKGLEARGEPAADDTDIGTQLLRVMKEHPEISRDRVLSEIGILFVEGFETTGHTTSWTLFNIATVPGVQEKIAEELDNLGLLAKPGCPAPRELEWEDLRKLPYLTAATKEAMRMLPVVSIMGRVAGKDMMCGPYRIPKGTVVATPLFAIQNTIHNWDAPHEFRPERWLHVPVESWVYNSRDAAKPTAAAASAPATLGSSAGGSSDCSSSSGGSSISSDGGSSTSSSSGGSGSGRMKDASALASSSKRGITFMPFSEGPRNCVGQSLAKMEVMTLLVKLLANFRIELAPEMGGREGVRSRESTHLTLQTAGTKGIRCHLHPRC